MRFSRGYTLVEMIVVLTLLGIASAMLVPHMVNSDTFSVQAATRAIIADITFAQNDAWASQQIRRFQFLEDENGKIHGYAILAPNPQSTYDDPFDPGTAIYLPHPSLVGAGGAFIVDFEVDQRFSGVEIQAVDLDGQVWIAFDSLGGPIGPAGQPFATGGTFHVRGPSGAYLIHLSGFTGKITLERIDD